MYFLNQLFRNVGDLRTRGKQSYSGELRNSIIQYFWEIFMRVKKWLFMKYQTSLEDDLSASLDLKILFWCEQASSRFSFQNLTSFLKNEKNQVNLTLGTTSILFETSKMIQIGLGRDCSFHFVLKMNSYLNR